MTILQILGMLIPMFCLFFIYIHVAIQCSKGRGDEPASTWEVILLFLSVFIEGFTLGTLITL